MPNKFDILLVDDEEDFLDPIAFWMESKGYAVRKAMNGQLALQKIEEQVPNIIFLDINMPVMNGIEALKHIRSRYPKIPVVMITSEIEKISSIENMGISGFFPKSGSLQQLEKLLEPVIRIHARMDSQESA